MSDLEELSHKTKWLFSYHRREAVAITEGLLSKLFQSKKDHLAEQMLHIIVGTLRHFWNQPDNEALLRPELAELKRLKEQMEHVDYCLDKWWHGAPAALAEYAAARAEEDGA